MGVLRPRYLTIAAADLAGALTAVLIVAPAAKFAYQSPSSHIMLETAAAMIAVFAAVLVYGRLRSGALLSDLLLLVGLCFFALPKFVVPFVADAVAASPGRFSAWATLLASVIGSAFFALAALLPDRRLSGTRIAAPTVGASLLGAVAVGALLARISGSLPLGLNPAVSDSSYPQFAAPPIIGFEIAGLVFFGAAAIGFLRRAEWDGDEFMSWLAASAALASFARLNYLLFPSLYPEWVYPADILRLVAYLLILVGAMREIRRYQRALARGAILDERRRMARELHDGLAQELAFIVTKTRELAANVVEPSEPELTRLAAAGERALDESRRAITALSAPVDESMEAALVQTVEQVAARVGTDAEVVVEPGIVIREPIKEALLRIVREAVTNASRHGGARTVRVELSNGNGIHLLVHDDGAGFDPVVATMSGGFGLTTMSERVKALGGALTIASDPALGTKIEVSIP